MAGGGANASPSPKKKPCSKTIGLYTIHTSNNCSTIRDVPFLGKRHMRAMTGELQLQTYIKVSF